MNDHSNEFIQIDPQKPNNAQFVTNDQFEDLKKRSDSQGEKIDSHKRLIDWTFGFIVAVLIVCVIAVITFLIDAWRYQANEYTKFTEALNRQEIQESAVTEHLHELELKIQKIELENEKLVQRKVYIQDAKLAP